MEIVITRGFHSLNLFQQILRHRLIHQPRPNPNLRRIRTENTQQTNRTLQILVFLIEPELDVVVVVVGQEETGDEKARAVFGLEV